MHTNRILSRFWALCTEDATIERTLQVKPGQTLKNLGLWIGNKLWISSLLIHEGAKHLKMNHKGEINNCGLCLAGLI